MFFSSYFLRLSPCFLGIKFRRYPNSHRTKESRANFSCQGSMKVQSTFFAAKSQSFYKFCSVFFFFFFFFFFYYFLRRYILILWFYYDIIMWNGTLDSEDRVALKVLSPRGVTIYSLPTPVVKIVECPLRGTGGHGFDPGTRHTKVVNPFMPNRLFYLNPFVRFISYIGCVW